MRVPSYVHLFELLLADASGLTLVIVVESFGIDQNLDYGVSYAAPDKVF